MQKRRLIAAYSYEEEPTERIWKIIANNAVENFAVCDAEDAVCDAEEV